MRKLECFSTDNLNYEEENLEFKYNGHIIFRQSTRPLNRGGKTLVLIDVTCQEIIITSGPNCRGKSWFNKIKNALEELNYNIELDDITTAILDQRNLNIKKYKQQLELENKNIKEELNSIEKRSIYLRKTLKENQSNINRYTDKI